MWNRCQSIGVRGHLASKNDGYNTIEESMFAIGDATADIFDTREDLHTQRGKPVEDMINIPLEGNMEKYQ